MSPNTAAHGVYPSGPRAPGDLDVGESSRQELANTVCDDWAWVEQIQPVTGARPTAPNDSITGVTAAAPEPSQNANPTRQIPQDLWQELLNFVVIYSDLSAKCAAAREELVVAQEHTSFERQEYLRQQEFFQHSQGELISQLAITESYRDPDLRATLLADLHKQASTDFAALRDADERLRESETILSRTEFYLRGKEDDLAKVSSELVTTLTRSGLMPIGRDESTVPSAPATRRALSLRAPSPIIPQALETYYNKAGTVQWRTERLQELKQEYQEALDTRLFRQDRGDLLEFSDEAFNEQQHKHLSDAQGALDIAKLELEDAQQACGQADLHPITYQHSILDTTETSVANEQTQSSEIPESNPSLRMNGLLTSERNESSIMLTNLTGPIHTDGPLKRRRKRDAAQINEIVYKWMDHSDLTPTYPWDVDGFEENPKTRPVTIRRRSIYDLKKIPAVNNPEIREHAPQRLRAAAAAVGRSEPEPAGLYGRRPAEKLRHMRSWSESQLADLQRRVSAGSGYASLVSELKANGTAKNERIHNKSLLARGA